MIWLLGVIGLVVGSFLNVVIDRVPARQSLLAPGSHCPACGRALRPVELLPVISYLALRGSCRTCGAHIPWRVPAVEFATGVLFAFLAYWVSPISPGGALRLAAALVYGSVMIVLLVIDMEHRRVPNVIVLPAIVLALALAPVLAWGAPRYADYGFLALFAPADGGGIPLLALAGQIAGGAVALGIFWLIWMIAPQGMGAGDVKLAAFSGLIAGFPGALAAVFGSFILGGAVGATLMLAGRAGRKTAVPFAPFLIVTTFVMMAFGDELLLWYLGR